jgi:Gpi18-like mannosyltransferase
MKAVGGRTRELIAHLRVDGRWQQWSLLAIAFGAAVGLRWALEPHMSHDFTRFLDPWFQHLKAHGVSGLADDFANYNVPYLYLLYLGTLMPLPSLAVVKLIALVFDLVLAAGVVAIAWQLRRSALVAGLAGVTALLLPEVFLNSAMWGQADSVYTAFIVWMAYFIVTRRDILAWVAFAIAFSVKLQGLFFLPWLLLAFMVQRHRWRAIPIGVAVFFVTYLPALVAGRPLGSLLGIYVNQSDGSHLVRESPNIYQWVPNELFEIVNRAGIFLALGAVAILGLLYLRRAPSVAVPELWLLQVGAAVGVLVPFLLPQMHDRYFYAAGILVAICALITPLYLLPAILMQFTAVLAYSSALFGVAPPIPLKYVAVLQFAIVAGVVWASLARPLQRVSGYWPHEKRAATRR